MDTDASGEGMEDKQRPRQEHHTHPISMAMSVERQEPHVSNCSHDKDERLHIEDELSSSVVTKRTPLIAEQSKVVLELDMLRQVMNSLVWV